MPQNKYTQDIAKLAAAGQFDADVRPVNPRFVKKMNPQKFRYRKKNPVWYLYVGLVRGIAYVFGPVLTWLLYDLRVQGKKHLRALKGRSAIVVSNHVSMLDALYLRQVSRTRAMYYLAAPFNHKKGLPGLTLQAGGILPVSDNFHVMKQLDATITDLLKKRTLLTIYAEESMWTGYQKIRPLKKGAFHYAAKNQAPILPVVALFRPTRWWDKLIGRPCKITLQILPPLFPDTHQDWHDNVTPLQTACHQAMVDCANAFYGCESDATKF